MDPFADDAREASRSLDPSQLLRSFWRRRLLFAIPFLVCFGLVILAINVITPVYLSSAQLRVVWEASPSSVVPRESRPSVREMDHESLINIQTILTGPKFLESVGTEWQLRLRGDQEGVPDSLTAEEASWAGAQLARKLHIAQDGPHLFSIGVRDPDPLRAYHLARLLLDRFMEEERATRLRPSASSRDFLTEQREVYRREVAEAEKRLTDFQQTMISTNLAGNPVNEGNVSHFETVLARLRNEVYETDAAGLANLERQARAVLRRLPSLGELSRRGDIGAAMRELGNLEYDSILGLALFEGSMERGDQMGNLRLRLNRAIEAEVSRLHPSLGVLERSQVASYLYERAYQDVRRGVVTRLQDDLQEYRSFVTRQPEQSAQLTRLREEAERSRQQLMEIERNLTQENLRMEASLSEIGYRMVVRDDPAVPLVPVEPDRMRLSFLGLLLALFVGGGLVVLAEMTDRSFRSVAQIERELGLPVVGTLPVVDGAFFGRRRRRPWAWLLVFLVIAAVGLLALGPRLG